MLQSSKTQVRIAKMLFLPENEGGKNKKVSF